MEGGASAERSTSSAAGDAHRLRNGLIWTAALLLLLLAIGLAVPDLRSVIDRAAEANGWWIALGVGLEIVSCVGYVGVVRLVLHRGPKREVRRLAWAEMAFGAVVPVGGAGGLAVGAWAMRAWGIAWSRIVNRSAVIFLLTSAVNSLVLALAGIVLALGIGAAGLPIQYGILPAVVALGAVAAFAALPRFASRPKTKRTRGKISQALAETGTWVRDTEKAAVTPDWRVLGSVVYLIADIAVLWACLKAVGVAAPVVPLVIGYQVGYMANILPIPGGVGVLEGGLLGALLLYGLPAVPTAAAVVLYHAIALWVPTLGGTVAFARLRRTVAAGDLAVDVPAEYRAKPASDQAPAIETPATAAPAIEAPVIDAPAPETPGTDTPAQPPPARPIPVSPGLMRDLAA
jgi:uncharacterized membrane protein YbhN (UPF0104 family)